MTDESLQRNDGDVSPSSAYLLLGLVVITLVGWPLYAAASEPTPFAQPPAWARDAIWYQIFVERFRNGDASNDPTPASMAGAYPGAVPKGWKVTPWGHDWYEPDQWFGQDDTVESNFYRWVHARRFGGDLQGVINQLDDLQDLGVTALYFNPLNDSPSLHKYDARHYRHIDRHFGPDPVGDAKIISAEDPLDPSTWQWTAADRLFLKLIKGVHRRDMRLIIDYSWNHTGVTFWAWKDVEKYQANSRFRAWYDIVSFDDAQRRSESFSWPSSSQIRTPFSRKHRPTRTCV